jgi:glycine C-acetyltransferase
MPMVYGLLKRLELVKRNKLIRKKLWDITKALQNGLKEAGFDIGITESPVTPVYLSGTEMEAAEVVKDLRDKYRIFCSMVIYPVVPKGVIILRLIPTAKHTMHDVNLTIEIFKEIQLNLNKGYYANIATI